MNRDHFVIFEIAPKYCTLNSFVDYEDYSISSKGFVPIVVDRVIWIKSHIPVHFSSLTPKMLMFRLAISCLTTANSFWFMDLTFQVPMQYGSLQHNLLLPSPVTSSMGHCFCFGSISPFFLELFLHSSAVANWAPTSLGSSSFNVLSFCLFILFGSWWRVLIKPDPLKKRTTNPFSILALRPHEHYEKTRNIKGS